MLFGPVLALCEIVLYNSLLSLLFSGNNPGIFQNTLKLVLQFAPDDLKTLLNKAPKNATYRSKTIQNQIIDVMGDYIVDNIVGEVKKTRFFSVLADEATDISNKEQMSLVLRYLSDTNRIKEKFVSFIHCKEGTSGEALALQIENGVEKIGMFFYTWGSI